MTAGEVPRPAVAGGVPWLVALAVVGLDLATAAPTVFFGDAGELIAAADSLGVAHPPGYPLYTLLAKMALLLPLGEAAWRVNALSALFAAAACGTVAWLVGRWSGSRVAAAAGGLGLAVAHGFWTLSTVAEVYTLHVFLVALLLALASAYGDPTRPRARSWLLPAAAVVLGLGLSHRPTIALALPAALLLAWPRDGEQPSRRAWLAAAAAVVGLPALLYGTLLLRATAEPAVNWGRPDDLGALWAHVTTRSFRAYLLGPAGWLRPEAWARLAQMLWRGFAFVGLPLAGVGLVAAWTAGGRRGRRGAAALLLLACAAALFGLSYATEDVEVLFAPVLLATAAAAGLGVAALARLAGPTGSVTAIGLTIVLVGGPLWLHLPAGNRRGVTAAADYGRDMLATVPPDGVLFVEGDDAFVLAYLQQVLGERRDVRIYDRNGLMFRDLLAEPGPAPRPGEHRGDYRVRRETALVVHELQQPRPRAVLFMSWPGYELPAGLRFEPHGLLYRVRRAGAPPLDPDPLWRAYRAARIEEQARRIGDRFALTVAAIYPLMQGERSRFEGDLDRAVGAYERASRLAGPSESIHNYIGTIFGRMGDLERAEREFLEAVRIKPVSVRAWNNLGKARLLRGDVEGAGAAWRRSLALDPNQPEIRASLRAR